MRINNEDTLCALMPITIMCVLRTFTLYSLIVNSFQITVYVTGATERKTFSALLGKKHLGEESL